MRQILHVDMDAFFAAVEQRDDPSLRGRPVIVGGVGPRGVVAAASYEVRRFGVRSAMAMVEALRRCPQAVVIPGRHRRYAEVSAQVFAIFGRFTPLVEGLSVDEAFLDVTASAALFGDGAAIARRIKQAIRDELSLTASAGVAPTKLVAKIASDLEKPDGLVVVEAGEVAAVLGKLPIERMWGIGPKSAPLAHAAGFHTLGDLQRASPERLRATFGEHGAELGRLARGDDPREVVPGREALSIGAEETFERDLTSGDELTRRLLSQSARVAERLFAEGLAASSITVKVKYGDFTIKTRGLQLPEPVADTDAIFRAATQLLGRFDLDGRRVRLTGVAASKLGPIDGVPLLFPDPQVVRGRKLEATAAALRERFGRGVLTRASLLDDPHEDRHELQGSRVTVDGEPVIPAAQGSRGGRTMNPGRGEER